jgi:ubiquinone biosynthesis protein
MIGTVRRFSRLLHISYILAVYRIDALLEAAHLFRPVKLLRVLAPWDRRGVADKPRGERLRLALQALGPVYVKFGQILSTRRDLLPPDVAEELALLQDRVPPFPGNEAQSIIETTLGAPVAELFSEFSVEPLASASIAQVHAATLNDGSEVVVKVVRPGIAKQLRRDIDLLKAIAGLAEKYWENGDRIRPRDVVSEFETFVFDELDMKREAANASALRRNFVDSSDLYIPKIYWQYTADDVLVMERVSGLPAGDTEGLKAAGVNLERLARRGVRVFYTQVFRDNLFHADMHPGNILIDATDPEDPTFILMDFGIVASLTPSDLYYISENFLALFNQNYLRIAELHIDAGWVPADTRLDELEASVRTVGEANFSRPLNEISFGELLLDLFRVAHRFRLTIQPQLIMLQKTLLNIEGLGRNLNPDLDLWAVAKPELETILKEKYGLDNTAKELRERLPAWLAKAPDMPGLIHDYLSQATRGQLTSKLASEDLELLRGQLQRNHSRLLTAVAAAALTISGALMLALETGPWFTGSFSTMGLVAVLAAGWLAVRNIRRG